MKRLLGLVGACGLLLSTGTGRAITLNQAVKDLKAAVKDVSDIKTKKALNACIVVIDKLSEKQIKVEKRRAAMSKATARQKKTAKKPISRTPKKVSPVKKQPVKKTKPVTVEKPVEAEEVAQQQEASKETPEATTDASTQTDDQMPEDFSIFE
jgi:outer membrane biosynthesis protein TonB